MKEKDFQRKLIDFLKKRNAFVFNFIGNVFQSGVPDLFVAHRYWSGWLELKTTSKLTEQQKHNLTELRRRGQNAYVVRYNGNEPLQKYILSNPDDTWRVCLPTMEELWVCLTELNKG